MDEGTAKVIESVPPISSPRYTEPYTGKAVVTSSLWSDPDSNHCGISPVTGYIYNYTVYSISSYVATRNASNTTFEQFC